mmetsp:Transcript_26723/g.57457  ORF Transcript_26723/g.57457 Transcript_26723/m.57457 type:complete len:274 (-) Transcript_26723:639-1460(-)
MIIRKTAPTSRQLFSWCSSNNTTQRSVRRRNVQCCRMPSVSVMVPLFNHSQRSQGTFLSSSLFQLHYTSVRSSQYLMNPLLNHKNLLGLGARCLSSSSLIYSSRNAKIICPDSHRKWMYAPIIKRDLASSSEKNKITEKNTSDNTLNTLQESIRYVKTHLSLDIWTINVILLAVIIGPVVWKSMKNSNHSDDHYSNVPVDDPIEHSVRSIRFSVAVLFCNNSCCYNTCCTCTIEKKLFSCIRQPHILSGYAQCKISSYALFPRNNHFHRIAFS